MRSRSAGETSEKASGNPEKARDLLEQALKEFETMGMRLWEGRTRKALGDL